MHHEFSGGCHIENNNEHERSFSAPSFSPFHQEQQGCFREMQNNRFGGVSVHLPEITINIGGGEPPCMPGFERHIPGPPGFYSMPPEFGGGYVFGPRFANPGYDPNYAYEGGNPNFANPDYADPNYANPNYENPNYANPNYANPNYAYDGNNQNYAGAPSDNGQYPGQNGNYSDNTAPGVQGDVAAPQLMPSGNGDTPNLVESSYNDPGVDTPHTNYGYGQDAPPNPAPAAQSSGAPEATITPTAAQTASSDSVPLDATAASPSQPGQASGPQDAPATPTSGQTQDNSLPPTAGDVVADGQEIANELAANKPLGLTDIGYYLSSAQTNSAGSDQTNNPAAAPIDQSNTPAITTVDQTNTPASTSLDQTNNPAAAPIDQTNTPAITTVDQTNTPASTSLEQTNNPAAAPIDQTNTPAITTVDQTNTPASTSLDQTNRPAATPADTQNQNETSLSIPNIYDVPDLRTN
jgi:hypothetical protein